MFSRAVPLAYFLGSSGIFPFSFYIVGCETFARIILFSFRCRIIRVLRFCSFFHRISARFFLREVSQLFCSFTTRRACQSLTSMDVNIDAMPATGTPTAAELEKTQAELAEMMNEAGIDRVQVLDNAGRIIIANRMCEEITGLPREQMIGRFFFDVFPEARAWPAIEEAIEQALQGRRSFVPAEQGAYERGHHERHFMPLRDAGGNVRGVLYIIHDVAHRVAAEDRLKAVNRELAQKLRELQRANAELATFTHVTSHDLKEPLRKIYTFVELTITEEQGHLSDKGRSNLRRVQSSVQRMGLLTDDLVMFADISAGDDGAEPLDLAEILRDAQKPLRKAISESGAVIEAGELPTVTGPRKQYALLFQHLLSNAVKFIAPGTQPRVRLEADTVTGSTVPHADALPDAAYHRIAVTDNGIGIEEEYFDKIFTLFQRLHGKGEYGGTGIGLAVVKKIVERRGGFITVESTPGAGSTFTCWLQVMASGAVEPINEPETESLAAG